jgi:hypothetical protein
MEKDNNFNEKLHIFNGLNSLEIMIRNLEIGTIESIKKLNPFMQMFFDSDLDSEIEKSAIMFMSDAYYSTIVEITSGFGLDLKKAQALGSSIAYTISYTMGLAKLTDKYFRGQINEDKYYFELSKRIATGAISLLKQNWKTLGKYFSMGLRGTLLYVGIDPVTIETCISLAERVGSYLKTRISSILNSDNALKFIENGLRYTAKAFKVVTQVVTTGVEFGKTAIKKTKQFVENIAKKLEVSTNNIYTWSKNVAKDTWKIAKDKGRKLKEWIKNRITN